MIDTLKKAWHSVYHQFISMKDSPQNIALGFGIGFFLGILPFTGMVAAIGVAWFFRLNKPAAILGSLLANTWLSIVLFGVAVHVGSKVLGISIEDIQVKCRELIKDFHWANLLDPFFLKIVGTVLAGFLILSILLSLVAYGACLAFIYWKRRAR